MSRARDDGTRLRQCAISAAVRCAPPGNRPTPAEVARCRPFLDAEWDLFRQVRGVLALGRLAFDEALALFRRHGLLAGRQPRFAHGLVLSEASGGPVLFTSYHVSQQNTFTRRLTPEMLDSVLDQVRRIVQSP